MLPLVLIRIIVDCVSSLEETVPILWDHYLNFWPTQNDWHGLDALNSSLTFQTVYSHMKQEFGALLNTPIPLNLDEKNEIRRCCSLLPTQPVYLLEVFLVSFAKNPGDFASFGWRMLIISELSEKLKRPNPHGKVTSLDVEARFMEHFFFICLLLGRCVDFPRHRLLQLAVSMGVFKMDLWYILHDIHTGERPIPFDRSMLPLSSVVLVGFTTCCASNTWSQTLYESTVQVYDRNTKDEEEICIEICRRFLESDLFMAAGGSACLVPSLFRERRRILRNSFSQATKRFITFRHSTC